MPTKKKKKRTSPIKHFLHYFAILKTRKGEFVALPELMQHGKSVRNITVVSDTNGFAGVSVCSHKDIWVDSEGLKYAFDRYKKARTFGNQQYYEMINGKHTRKLSPKIFLPPVQTFPPKELRSIVSQMILSKPGQKIEWSQDDFALFMR